MPAESPPIQRNAPLPDTLYLRKIHDLEALNARLMQDLELTRQNEDILKEDVLHKRTLITHMLHNRSEVPQKQALPGGFRGFFRASRASVDDLERALEESIADNMRLRDNIRVLSDQLRPYL